MFDFLLIDLDDTILDFQQAEKNAIESLCNALDISERLCPIPLYQAINLTQWKLFEAQLLSLDTLKVRRFDLFLQALGMEGDAEALAHEYEYQLSLQAPLLPGAYEAVKELATHYPIYIASNGISHIQRSRIAIANLESYFEDIFLSHEIGYAKPDSRYFDVIAQRVPAFEAGRGLMIGDSLTSDIAGGNNYGLKTVWIQPEQLARPSVSPATYTLTSLQELPNFLRELESVEQA